MVSLLRKSATSIFFYSLLLIITTYFFNMSFRNKLSGLFDKAEQAINQHAPQVPLHSKPHSPAVPTNSKPPPGYPGHPQKQEPGGTAYWQPTFDPAEPVSTHFRHEEGQHGWGNNEAQNYGSSSQNSFHAPDNALILRALINSSHPDQGQKYTSARLTSHQTLSRPRGCLSATITAPVAQGIWPAFWLLPHDPFTWPNDGEIDIFEAWDGDTINHSCLHWGFFDGNDWNKHRVLETPIPRISSSEGVRFDFAWEEDEGTGQGRMVWYIDGRPIMKAEKPVGTRRLKEFRILINVAVGGNVCKGHMPTDGMYEMRVRDLTMWEAPPRGWEGFERAYTEAKAGHPM